LQQLISSPHRSPSRRSLSHHHDSRQSSPNRTPGDAVWSLISPPLQLIAVGLPVAGPCLIRFSPVLIESHSQRRCLVSPSSAHLSSLLLCLSGLDGSVSDLRRIFGNRRAHRTSENQNPKSRRSIEQSLSEFRRTRARP
ncbi:hypothetical protein HN873_003373, partial [Arachis hypogaea]